MFNSKTLMIYGAIVFGLSPLYQEFGQVYGMEKIKPKISDFESKPELTKPKKSDFETAVSKDIIEHYVSLYPGMARSEPECFKTWVDSVYQTEGGKLLLKKLLDVVGRQYVVTEKDNTLGNYRYLQKVVNQM